MKTLLRKLCKVLFVTRTDTRAGMTPRDDRIDYVSQMIQTES